AANKILLTLEILDINILNDPKWKIEIPSHHALRTYVNTHRNNQMWGHSGYHAYYDVNDIEYVSINDYVGGYFRPPSELASRHVQSPLQKIKKKV
ncbi:MAG: hypothetical protein ACC656_08970, partial [Candidatus Heimdallarchaeota archaeon]